jgi:TatD DNase family protein
MKFIDTHTHLYLEQFDEDREEVVKRAMDEGVCKLLLPNVDEETYDDMMQLAKRFPDACIPMIGLHPTSVGENYNDQLDFYEQKLAGDHNFIAIGEIGIDLYWETKYVLQQKEAFARQIELAKRMQLPVVIHARESFREIFDILDKMDDENLSGVFHSFTGTL